MAEYHEIRALYDRDTITVYQAYSPTIAKPALEAGRFVAPFSFSRMTWIKPSFLWMMERCGWGTKSNQEVVLAVRITRAGWEEALSHGVLTHHVRGVHATSEEWAAASKRALVQVQWDPERSLRGGKLDHRAIQVGISRHLIETYVSDWIVDLEDVTPLAKKIKAHVDAGRADRAKPLLPRERVYPVPDDIAKRLAM